MGPAFVCLHWKRSPLSLSTSPACLVSPHHLSDSGGSKKKKNCNSEIVNCLFSRTLHSLFVSNHPWPKTSTHFVPRHAHRSHLLWTTDIPFVHCTFNLHFNSLPVNFHQTNIFSIWKQYYQPHYTWCGIFIFMFIFNNYNEEEKTNYDIILCNKHFA